jgi:hypothetical protein
MAKQLFEVTVRSFESGETRFKDRAARIPAEGRDELANIVTALFEASSQSGADKFVSLTIVGHSDRHDLQGLSLEQRKAVELERSKARADSTSDFFLEKLGQMQDSGAPVAADWAAVDNVAVTTVSAGAANLINPTPGNDEQQRLENRRVQILGTLSNITSVTLTNITDIG